MSSSYEKRLLSHIDAIAEHFGTPFHIYDEVGIRETCQQLKQSFESVNFREYFAVKALPNPTILKIIHDEGFGFDCSSLPEIILARQIGATGEDILFTSNNTTPDEFIFSLNDGGCILNLDDISLIDKVPTFPDLVCFRYNPGNRRSGNAIIGEPEQAKFGVTHDQLQQAYALAKSKGATRFGLHTMVVSNERDEDALVETAMMLLDRAQFLTETLDIQLEFLNLGGGLGIPYRPDDSPINLSSLSKRILEQWENFSTRMGYQPKLMFECGRYITGAHGVLVTRAINHKNTYRNYVGVDASMSALMRPGMYDAYHHVTLANDPHGTLTQTYDIVGSLCENNDKFASNRKLPEIDEGDLLIIHDTGAHGHAMGFNYNGRLKPQELLLHADGSISRIRCAETMDDYFATLSFDANELKLG